LAENELTVTVDNGRNRSIYPQKADFTFYGGLYRDVMLIDVPKEHFALDYFGGTTQSQALPAMKCSRFSLSPYLP